MQNLWIESVFQQSYTLMEVIRNSEKSRVSKYRHDESGKVMIRRDILNAPNDVYSILKMISHPNIVLVYDALRLDEGTIVLEEFIEGCSLYQFLKSNPLSVKEARGFFNAVCDGMITLHNFDIVHRDIKPGNVMIDENGHVKIIDFDVSRLYKPFGGGDTQIMGTVGYAAPEQFGIAQTDKRSDIFSLGILLNVMLTGEHPSNLLHKGKYTRLIEKCIQTNPKKRFQSVGEIKNSL